MGIDAKMFVRTRELVTEEQEHRWRYELASAFGPDRFLILRPGTWNHMPQGQHCLSRVDLYYQDGPDVTPEPGETFLQVHLITRYYGVGYERGDLPFLLVLAEWLELKIPGATVWYGGDSSGVEAIHFDRAARTALLRHFAQVDHRPYVEGFNRIGREEYPATVICDFCRYPLNRYGWGQNYAAFHCRGCGAQLVTRDNGLTYTNEQDGAYKATPTAQRLYNQLAQLEGWTRPFLPGDPRADLIAAAVKGESDAST